MDQTEKREFSEIPQETGSGIPESDARALQPILKQFMEHYLENKDRVPPEQWLPEFLGKNLPESAPEEVSQMADEILSTIKMQEEKKASLETAVQNGRSKESWFAKELLNVTSCMSTQQSAEYLTNLDNALANANQAFYDTIHTHHGEINQNPHLDGFIAEQYHAQTFNLNAAAKESSYHAKVLEPNGKGYAKNSVDLVIENDAQKPVSRYQSKYCKDAHATSEAFKRGDYRGQQKLVPSDQVSDIPKKATSVIKAPDGTTSNALTKEHAVELRREAQSGQWQDLNWNEYQAKDLAMGIGKQAGQAALMGAAVSAGMETARKVWQGEKIDGAELVQDALVSGADFGIKAAAAGALKVGAEKELIHAIPKGTPAGQIANIAHVAIEDVKVLGKIASGELSAEEGADQLERTTVSTIAGIAAAAEGTAIGITVGGVLGPVGAAVGGFIGGSIGYMAGSSVADAIVRGKQKLRNKIVEVLQPVGTFLSESVNAIQNGWYGIKSLFGR